MRVATIRPRASVEPVPVAASPDGTWIELAALTGRPVPRLELGPEKTGGWLKPGDVVELEIERVGILRTRIVAPPRVA